MKKFLQSMVARGLSLLVIGILLIVFAESITTWLVMLCGLAFIVPGAVAVASAFRQSAESRLVMLYPVIGIGSIAFGIVLLIWPALFVETLMYILAAGLIFVACCQLYSLWTMHRSGLRFSIALYLAPIAELAAGLYIILAKDTMAVAALPVIIVGAGFILYALMEFSTAYVVRRAAKTLPPPDAA